MLKFLLLIVLFAAVYAFWKKGGFRFLRFRGSRRSERVLFEDALKHIYKCEKEGQPLTLQNLAGQIAVSVDQAAALISELQRKGLLTFSEGQLHLTPEGQDYALHVIRAHRLWERYLADRTGVAETEWHGRAEQLEHRLTPEQADVLSAELGHPTHDPHGDPVPTPAGSLRSIPGLPLMMLEAGQRARITHIEDEPESVYAQLVDKQIHPGMEFELLERTDDEFRIEIEGGQKTVSAVAAANITTTPLAGESEIDFSTTCRLSDLRAGEKATVVAISRASRGIERRRFMDLGILPGTTIFAELTGPGGDPVAYRIREALIALRREQANHIFVDRIEENTA
jgi:DtxR family Mn-dependent transcriptional regulator